MGTQWVARAAYTELDDSQLTQDSLLSELFRTQNYRIIMTTIQEI
jgi:hypothetical protein